MRPWTGSGKPACGSWTSVTLSGHDIKKRSLPGTARHGTARHGTVIDHVRSVKELIAKRKRAAKAANRKFDLVDDELKLNVARTEAELRAALGFLDRDDAVSANQIFDEAMSNVPMPEVPKSLRDMAGNEPVLATDIESAGFKRGDSTRFRDFT